MLQMIPRHPRRIGTSQLQEHLVAMGFPTTLRTIQRDLNNLSRFFPLQCDDEKIAGWSWPHDVSVDIPGMDPYSALTFHMVERFLKQMLPGSCVSYMSPQFRQANNLINNSAGELTDWPKKIHTCSRYLQLTPPEVSSTVLEQVYEAVLHDKKLEVAYRKRGHEDDRSYLVNPLGIVFVDQLVYLVCTFNGYSDLRHLALHRISSAITSSETVETVETVDGFVLSDYVQSGVFGLPRSDEEIDLDILFDAPTASHLLESPLCQEQKSEVHPDGRVLIQAKVGNTDQLRWWILGFGPKAEVIAPSGLREEVRELLLRGLQHYREKS